MPERTVIQWEKDDLEALGLLKVDVLALGMLTTIRRSFDLVRRFRGREYSFDGIPPEEACVYEMISEADTIAAMADKGKYDLLVLGSHGHSSLGNLVMGSVATKVVAQCGVPVLLVR